MALLPCLILGTAAAATIPLGPAPGASSASAIALSGHEVPLDAQGRGRIPRDAALEAKGLRFYRTEPDAHGGEQVFYYSVGGTLVFASLHASANAHAAEVVVKEHAQTWDSARSFEASIEPGAAVAAAAGGGRVRFVLPPGTWDAAIVVPGSAPAFAPGILAKGESLDLGTLKLQPAGRVKARVLDARSGKAPERWVAYVSRVGGDPKSEEAQFFEKRPVARETAALDFESLPVGGWQLRVESPGRSQPRKPVMLSSPGAIADLGDVYVTDFGNLRVVLEFPEQVPPGTFEIKLKRSDLRDDDPAVEIGSRSVTARKDTAVDFPGVEPGEIRIECSNKDAQLWREESAVVEPGQTAEARILVRPVRLHGVVRRGDETVPAAAVSSPAGRRGFEDPPPAMSDELGVYELKVWGGADTVFLTTLPPDQTTPYAEFVEVNPVSTEIEHDVDLPAAEIRGVVRDAATGAPLEGAAVDFTTALADQESEPNATSFQLGQKTDKEGRFRLANLTAHPVDVEVTHEGYGPAKFPTVHPTPEGVDLDVRLEKGIRLSGTVAEEDGSPVPGATVGLDVEAQGQFFNRTATTSGDGRFEFTGVASGSHALVLIRCGRTIVLRSFVVGSPEAEGAEGHREDIQLHGETPSLSVRFENADGSPAKKTMFRWAVDGVALPFADWYETVLQCGYPDAAEPDRILLHGFPPGTITALSFFSQMVYGTFLNDGSQGAWTIRIPSDTNAHAQTKEQASR